MASASRPRIRFAIGPRACERLVLAHVAAHLERLGEAALASPVHLVVPSLRLRNHLLASLVRERGRAAAGVAAWTHLGLAREIGERLGTASPAAGPLIAVLVRRLARREPALTRCLGHLSDGFATVGGSVRDLLQAGVLPAHAEALDEVLTTEGRQAAGSGPVERARSLVRVAAGTLRELERLGLDPPSTLLQRAAEQVRSHEAAPLPVGALLVHGFADATGAVTDFLQSLLQRFGGTIFLDRPADPARPGRQEPGVAFSRRFTERLLSFAIPAGRPAEVDPPLPPPRTRWFRAWGAQAEVREVARRIRGLLDGGCRAEGIGVVTRQLEPYRSALRSQFWRLGIPFSGLEAGGPRGAAGRRVQALVDLVGRGELVAVDRWLDARHRGPVSVAAADLRIALFGLGCGRLGDVAELDPAWLESREDLPLPVRHGYDEEADDSEEEPRMRLRRRTIPVATLRQARTEAAAIRRLFADWRRCSRLAGHLGHLRTLAQHQLAWPAESDPSRLVFSAVERASRGLPARLELTFEEFQVLLREVLAAVGTSSLGGAGAGVQILDVTAARAVTFEHLFLVGLNRDVFPRVVREDPLLPDSLRRVLGREGHGVLPDLPRKLGGFDEERFLFAQLAGGGDEVTLSWQEADDDGKPLTPSPLVQRIRWSALTEGESTSPSPCLGSPLAAPSQRGGPTRNGPRTAFEHALRAALWGSRRQLAEAITVALETTPGESGDWLLEASPARTLPAVVAAARLRLLEEADRAPGRGSRLGPFFGFVGPARGGRDPRLRQKLYVTTLEGLARCPWQTFLVRLLRIEPSPDPLEILPGLEPLLIGQLVHRVLERLVAGQGRTLPKSLDAARDAEPAEVSWPDPNELERLAAHEARRVARDAGVGWKGFAEVLGRVILPYLAVARRLLEDDGEATAALTVELEGSLQIRGPEAEPAILHFKADRVDGRDRRLLLTDFKTSRRGVSEARREATRRRHLLAAIHRGRLLQAAAYAAAAGRPGDSGRYLFVHPDLQDPEESRVETVAAEDSEMRTAFDTASGVLLRAWHAGTFFPRLVEPLADSEPRTCEFCSVAEACLRGDSGARGRLRDWTAARLPAVAPSDRPRDAVERALLAAWYLGEKS